MTGLTFFPASAPRRRRGCNGAVADAVQGQRLAPHLDAELLALGAQLEKAWDDEKRAWAVAAVEEQDDGPCSAEAIRLGDLTSEIVRRIEQASARTVEGLRVKRRAIASCRMEQPVTAEDFDHWGGPPSTQTRLLVSLLRDLDG